MRRKYTPPYKYCKNCGAELIGAYCHKCGQFAYDSKQPFWKYIQQYFENVYQFDTKIPNTVWQLFRRPGFLTNEFNSGKIASYMNPLKLNMFILIIVFTAVMITGKKFVNKELVSANIPGYIKEKIESDKEYFSGKKTTLFLIGNAELLNAFGNIFTIEKEFGKKSRANTGYIRPATEFSYTDEQDGKDTLLVTIPTVFLQDNIITVTDKSVPDDLFIQAGISRADFLQDRKHTDKMLLGGIAGNIIPDSSAGRTTKMSKEIVEKIVDNILPTVMFYKVTPERKYTRIDDASIYKTDMFLAMARSYTPIIILLSLPFMAFLLKITYKKKGMNYISHFVFSLHFCAAMFILMLLFLVLAMCTNISFLTCFVWYCILQSVYFIIASHTVYTGTGWIKCTLKSMLILFCYFTIVCVLIPVMSVIAIVGIMS